MDGVGWQFRQVSAPAGVPQPEVPAAGVPQPEVPQPEVPQPEVPAGRQWESWAEEQAIHLFGPMQDMDEGGDEVAVVEQQEDTADAPDYRAEPQWPVKWANAFQQMPSDKRTAPACAPAEVQQWSSLEKLAELLNPQLAVDLSRIGCCLSPVRYRSAISVHGIVRFDIGLVSVRVCAAVPNIGYE
jgi:hypothetical protein